ncbi:hypothetical protein [Streptomyces sp. NPDC001889]
MTRSAPSMADQILLTVANRAGLPLTAGRLQRWRREGLVPVFPRVGVRRVIPEGADELVMGLAFCDRMAPRLPPGDLALLAFFNEVPVPHAPVKAALARAYFGARFEREKIELRAYERITPGFQDLLPPEDNHADVAASVALDEGSAAVRQMRDNLRRRKDLARATHAELDQRVQGVLFGLHRPELRTDDHEFMADLRAALGFGGPPANSRAVWMLAAFCRSEQLAERSETTPERRLDELLALADDDLENCRDLVRETIDALWHHATEGKRRHYPVDSAESARGAGAMLVEWISNRQVHPAGSRPAQLYLDGLRSLWQICSPKDHGEGRAAFRARTGQPQRTS